MSLGKSAGDVTAMDLPNLFSNTIKPVARLFICSVLTDTTVQSLLIQTSVAGTKVLERSKVLTYTDASSLVVKTDETLQELGKESENINEVILALESSWLKDGAVVEAKKGLLHTMVSELSLKPLGFVIQSEALAQFVLASHAHASAIVLMIDAAKLNVFVIAQGKVGSVVTVGRSEDIAADVKESLARYLKTAKDTYLPAKMLCVSLVLDEKELTKCQQALLDVQWDEAASFVQTPTIDLLKSERATSILAHQAAVAATAATADETTAPPPLKNKADKDEYAPAKKDKAATDETTAEQASEDAPSVVPVSEDTAAQFGFASVGPQATAATGAAAAAKASETAVERAVPDDAPRSFGIPIRQSSDADDEETAVDEIDNDASFGEDAVPKKRKHNPYVFSAIGFGLGLVILAIAGFVWLKFYSKVVVSVEPKIEVVSAQVTITLDPELSEPDTDGLKIPAENATKELSTQEVISTTGIKITGEKATGKVKIQNKTTDDKTFKAGTVLSADSLEFTTNEDVTIDAAVEEGDTKKYGTATVDATAVVIGAESNIGEKTDLTVGSFDTSNFSAITENNFTGGSSREVKVVAEADQAELVAAAKKKLMEEAKEKFADESGGDSYFTPPLSITVTNTEYSAEVEEPADQLAGTITAEVVALSYSAPDLQPIAQAVLGSKVPEGYVLSDENPDILSDLLPAAAGASEQKLKANLSAQARPNLQFTTLAKEIVGLSPEQAREKLAGKHVSEVTFIYTPAFAQSLAPTLPSSEERITVVSE